MAICPIFAAVLTACGGGNSAGLGPLSGATLATATTVNPLRVPAPNSNDSVYKPLATENGVFKLDGVQAVRYGAGSSWVFASISGQAQCTNDFFGTDPLVGSAKACEWVGTTSAAPVTLATENQVFSVDGAHTVRYGADSRWIMKFISGSANCSNDFFGTDPAFGVVKSCQLVDVGSSIPVTLAAENAVFTVAAMQTVRYGVDSRWVTKVISGPATCSNTFFGTDPAFGTVKSCELLDASSAAPAPAPAPAPVLVASTEPVAFAPAPAPVALALTTTPAPVATPLAVTPAAGPAGPAASAPVSSLMPRVDITKLMAPAIGSSTFDVVGTTEVAPNGDGAFRTSCTPARMSFDDPIVFPGQIGRSHLHLFFGNTGTDANSTPDSIRNTGNSTCRGGIANRSAYWVPAMIDTQTGAPLLPIGMGVYYKRGNYPADTITPIPTGLRMIAGDPSASEPRDQWADFTYRWKCEGGPNNENDKYGSEIPNCDVGASAVMEVMFPQCWDGKNLDSPDHKSHMSYQTYQWIVRPASEGGNYNKIICPATHPVVIPAITFNVSYVVNVKDEPLHWRLSSDNYDNSKPGGYSSHGDWFNGWVSDVSNSFAKNCIQALKDCHSHLLGDGRAIF